MSESWRSGESDLMDSQTESLKRIADMLEQMLGIGKGYIEGRGYKPPIITNADRIRAMTDEELDKFICTKSTCSRCGYSSASGCGLLDWLKQGVDNGI